MHIEMFVEYFDPFEDLLYLLKECYPALMLTGILRIIILDAENFIKSYLSDGWNEMNAIIYGKEDWSKRYANKMEALNHVFL